MTHQPTGIATELNPELADKIFRDAKIRVYNERVSKKAVLHHLKQLKAQMGKAAKNAPTQLYRQAVLDCMEMISNKINKVNQ